MLGVVAGVIATLWAIGLLGTLLAHRLVGSSLPPLRLLATCASWPLHAFRALCGRPPA